MLKKNKAPNNVRSISTSHVTPSNFWMSFKRLLITSLSARALLACKARTSRNLPYRCHTVSRDGPLGPWDACQSKNPTFMYYLPISHEKSISMFIGLLSCMCLVEKSLSQYCDSFSNWRMVRAFWATVELLVPK